MSNESCLFCKIINGELPSYKIYEDEYTYAFLDIHPINRGHTLVIPKTHHANIVDTPKELFTHVMDTVRMLVPKVRGSVMAEGVNVNINEGASAGQIIFHLHVHIIPRWKEDGHAEWRGNPYQEGEIASVRDIIIQEFK